MCMFCSDDKHPDDLVAGHINNLVQRAVQREIDVMKVLCIASVNAVLHYGLDVGLLREGDWADFLEVDNLSDFNVLKTYLNGEVVAEDGRPVQPQRSSIQVNRFSISQKSVADFALPTQGEMAHVIEAIDGQLITNHLRESPTMVDGAVVSDTDRDILKIAVVNRYKDSPPAIGLIRNIGIKN